MRFAWLVLPFVSACYDTPPAALTADGSASYGGMRISAPIVPDSTFAMFSDPTAYAKLSAADKLALVQNHTFSFTQLLGKCAATDATIVTTPTTLAEYDSNYLAVAKCAYETLSMSPSWVPQLVADVDVCVEKSPENTFHTPTTAELVNEPQGYLPKLREAISATAVTQPMFASLRMYGAGASFVGEVDGDQDPPMITALTATTTLASDPVGVRCVYYDLQ